MNRLDGWGWVGLLPGSVILIALGITYPMLGWTLALSIPSVTLGLTWVVKRPRIRLARPIAAVIGFGLPFQLFGLGLNFSLLDLLIVLLFGHLVIDYGRRRLRAETSSNLIKAVGQPVTLWYAFFITVNILGLTLCLDLGKGLASVGQFALLLVWLITLISLLSRREIRRIFLLGGCFGAGLCALVGVTQHFWPTLINLPGVSAQRILSYQGRAPSLLGDPNYFAAYLITFAPITAVLLRHEKHKALRWLLGLNLAVMLPGFYYSYSRGGLIALGVMLIAGAIFLPRGTGSKAVALAVLLGLGLTLLSFVTLADKALVEVATGRFSTLLDEYQENRLARLGYTNTALNMFIDSPLIGRGPGQFPANFVRYRSDDAVIEWLTPVSHNSYAEVLATGGLFGTLCLTAFILTILLNLVRTGWRSNSIVENWQARSVLVGLIGLLVAALLLELFTQRYFFALLAFSAALGENIKYD